MEKVIFILYTGILYASTYSLIFLAVANERPVVVSVIMALEVVFTIIVQYIMLNLPVTWYSVLGGILITLSCLGIALTKQDDPEDNDLFLEK